jgi:hypothetical protein
MSIELHCPKCRKLIRAPDNAGGKHGRCPYCKESVYVPLPPADEEEIKLAPIDEEEERRLEELRRESTEYIATVGHETEDVPDVGDPPSPGPAPIPAPGEVVDLGAEVEAYLIAMRDSKLDEAEKVVARLTQAGPRARDYVEGMMIDEVPLQIENLPTPLAHGFLKTLLSRLT